VICLEEPENQTAVLTKCGHYFCEPCLKRTMAINTHCPICRAPLSSVGYIKKADLTMPEEIREMKESSKVTAILKILDEIHQRDEKCVVFTQWIKIIAIL
jgi:DNA repair protein RAD5